MTWFSAYLIIYSTLAFSWIWYNYAFVFANKKDWKHVKPYKTKVSLIIPFYNEPLDAIKITVFSCIRAGEEYKKIGGDYEIIIVDDGSTNKETYKQIKKLVNNPKVIFHQFKKNKGKRHGQAYGFKKATGELLITIDSDTEVSKKGIIELTKPFHNKNIAASTGRIAVLNKKDSWLTNIITARYWNACNVERKRQDYFNVVVCCSGPFSAYRRTLILNVLNKYTNQKFLGQNCTYGDDRHLTTLLLKDYEITYVDSAVVYTIVPETIKKYIKQQIRWKKSWLRENFILFKYMFKRSKFLAFDTLFSFVMPFFSLGARVTVLILMLTNFAYAVWFLSIIFIVGFLYNELQIFEERWQGVKGILYGYIHEFFIYWVVYYALLTLKDSKWGTR